MREKTSRELTAAIIANTIGVVLFNTVPLWRQYTRGVVLEDFIQFLWAANVSFLVQLAGTISMVFYRPPRFAGLVQVITAATSLMSMIVFYVLFPLDFGAVGAAWVNAAMKIVLIAGIGGATLAFIVQSVQLTVGWRNVGYSSK